MSSIQKFRHYKGDDYELITRAAIESTGERVVVYRALQGEREVWVRPEEEFFGRVDVEGGQVDRFVRLQASDYGADKVRKHFPNNLNPWSDEEDRLLDKMFAAMAPLGIMTERFGRTRGSIRERIAELELPAKYPPQE